MSSGKAFVYKDITTPVGLLRLIGSPYGLSAVLWNGAHYTSTKFPTAIQDDHAPLLLQTELQLREYFEKKRAVFNIPLDFNGTDFQVKVWKALLQIPYGATKTYGALARLLGDAKAVRAVGGALNKNPIAIIVPCHRVIGTSGQLVGFGGGLENKSILLHLENGHKAPTLFD